MPNESSDAKFATVGAVYDRPYFVESSKNGRSFILEQQFQGKLKLPHGIAGSQPRDLTECGSTEVIERRAIKNGVI